jgi:hypothetical protein
LEEFLILFIILFILFLLIVFKEREKNIIIVLSIFIFSLFVYFYILFLIGFGYSEIGGSFHMLVNRDIVFQIKLYLLMIINIEFSFIIKNIKNLKLFAICISCLLIILSLYNFRSSLLIKIKQNYYERYILERILLWYLYQNKKPILLGKNINQNENFYLYFDDDVTINQYIYHKKIKNGVVGISDYEYVETMKEVLEKYYENGGRKITEKEINEANFNKLLDKNWVLNGTSRI